MNSLKSIFPQKRQLHGGKILVPFVGLLQAQTHTGHPIPHSALTSEPLCHPRTSIKLVIGNTLKLGTCEECNKGAVYTQGWAGIRLHSPSGLVVVAISSPDGTKEWVR